MKIKFTVAVLMVLGFLVPVRAQLPVDMDLYGTWVSEGYEFQGSFYPSNAWNQETVTFHEDYTFERTKTMISDNRIDSIIETGKWNLTEKPQVIRFYSGTERYSGDGKILSFDTELKVNFLNPSYFTYTLQKGNYSVEMRFKKKGIMQSFEESKASELLKVMHYNAGYDTSNTVFYLVNSFNPKKRKPFYFDGNQFSVHIEKGEPGAPAYTSYSMNGEIHDFTDSTVRFRVYDENTESREADGSLLHITKDYFPYWNSDMNSPVVYKDIRKSELNALYFNGGNSTVSNTAKIVAAVSGFTALILAPLISINYKGGDFNQKRYFKTAGIGLIGLGVSIPVAIIFKPKPFTLVPSSYGKKNHWYLAKQRLE